MNSEALFVFVIILLGLMLFSFLGNKKCIQEGYTNTNTTGETNANANSETNTNAKYKYKYNHGYYDNYNHYSGTSTKLVNGTIFYGPNGATAEYIVASNGTATIRLIQTQGSSYIIFNQTPQGVQSTTVNTSSTNTF